MWEGGSSFPTGVPNHKGFESLNIMWLNQGLQTAMNELLNNIIQYECGNGVDVECCVLKWEFLVISGVTVKRLGYSGGVFMVMVPRC